MAVSRSKRTTQNALMGFTYQLVTMVLGFVSRVVFVRTIGIEFLGLNGVFSDVLSLLSMADLGFSTAMAYSFYKPLAEGNEQELISLVAFYKKIYNTIALVVLVLGLFCIPFLRFIVRTDNDIPLLEVYYLFSLINVVASYLFVYKTTLLTADQKDYKVVRIRMVTSIAKVVIQILMLVIFRSYILYLAVATVMGITGNLIASKRAEKEYPYIKKLKGRGISDQNYKGRILENMKSVFIYKLSTTVFSATDNIIISMVVSTVAVGMYSNYLNLSQKLLLMEQILFSSMTASIGNVIAREGAEKKYGVFQSVQSVSLILCGIITNCYCILADDFVGLLYGKEYVLPEIVVIAVTVNAYFACALQPLWLYRDATGLYRKTKYVMLVAAVENIVLSVILGKIMGIAGVIFASAISRLTTYCWYEPRLLFKEYFDKSAGHYFLQMILNMFLCGISIAVSRFIAAYINVDGLPGFILKGIVTLAFSTAVFMLVYLRTEGAQNIIKKVKGYIGR